MEISVQDAYRFSHIMDNIYNFIKGIKLSNDSRTVKLLIYEYNNCIERWIISTINATQFSKNDINDGTTNKINICEIFQEESAKDLKSTINITLADELFKKRLCKSFESAQGFIQDLFDMIQKELDKTAHTKWISSDMPKSAIEDILLKLDKSSDVDKKKHLTVLKVMYNAIARNKSQQWAIPVALYQYLYKIGLRYEGFASPINSRIIRIGLDGYYCSMFYAIDKYYNSIGSFFDADFPNKSVWAINPPYIIDIFDKMWKKMKTQLSQPKSLLLFCTLPDWSDYYMYQEMSNHPKFRAKITLEKKKHFYEDINGKQIVATFRSLIYIFDSFPDNEKIPVDIQEIKNILTPSVFVDKY